MRRLSTNGSSLNDLLLKGPDFVPSLISILWRARRKKIAFMADIQEMFHQVQIKEEDRNSQRFVWRGMDRNKEPDTYVMNVMIFIAISSPSMAQFVKNENAKELENKYPGVLKAIVEQHYVDDYFDCCDTDEKAINVMFNVIKAHREGGFKLLKFVSNSKKLLKYLSNELKANTETENVSRIERVLGLLWDIEEDVFVFPLEFKYLDEMLEDVKKIPSKRLLLKIMISVFDPLGILSLIVIKLKIMFQDLWRLDIQWDDNIPEGIFQRWKMWLEEVRYLNVIKVSRCYFPNALPYKSANLHIFSDASDKAFAACVYISIQQEDEMYVSLVSAKSRVVPMKHLTIPRLELQGAVRGSQLAKTIEDEVRIEIVRKYYWTDSMIVLNWLKNNGIGYHRN